MKRSRAARERDGGRNFDGFSLPPHNIVIIGVDTGHGSDHPLYSTQACEIASGTRDYDMRLLRSLHTFGVKVPVNVRHETVPGGAEAELWSKRFQPGETAHVLVAGRRRVLHGRRVVDEKFASGEIGTYDAWQVKCVLEHAKRPQELVAIVADENVCRRVLGEDEIVEGIQRGLSVSFTIEEMAERYGIKVSKAKRLLRRADGVPEKRKPTVPRLPGAAIRAACERLHDSTDEWSPQDVALLIAVVRGKIALMEAGRRVQALFQEAD